MKKYSNIILTFLILAILGACEDSLGTDPDYKTTIFDKDTVFKIDTVIQKDTVLRDSIYFIKTDSLITVTDSLGNVIDSLSTIISNIENRIVAPRFRMIVDSIVPLVTYEGQDTTLDINQQPVVIRTNKISELIPIRNSINKFSVEMDTNLNMNRAWVDFSLDGSANLVDSTIHFQQVFLDTSYIHIDSVHIFNRYSLAAGQNNFGHFTTIRDYNYNNITSNIQKDVSIEFEDYVFDSESKIIGYTIIINMSLEARNTQLRNPKSKYEFHVFLRYP